MMKKWIVLGVLFGLIACSPEQKLKEENEQLMIQMEELIVELERQKLIAEEASALALKAQIEAEQVMNDAAEEAAIMAEQLKNCK